GVLRQALDRAEARIGPERMADVDGGFLELAVGAVRRVRAAEADERRDDQRAGRILERVRYEPLLAVVAGDDRVGIDPPFGADQEGLRFDGLQRNVGARGVRLDDEVRTVAAEIPAAALAPEGVADQVETFEDLDIAGDLRAVAGGLVRREL